MKIFTSETPSSPAVPAPSSSPPPAIIVQVPDTSDRLQLRDYVDQTAAGSFKLLSEEEIAALRANFVTRTGGHPDPAERPSDEQLSAMAYVLRTKDGARAKAPFAEFAVFTPFDGRATKLRTFSAMVLSRDGSWAHRSLRGPSSFGQWENCWHVYATTLVMLDVAAPGALKTYFQAFRRLRELFPQEWGTLVSLEEQMRAEEWNLMRQEIAEGLLAPPMNYDPKAPWKTLIAASRPFLTSGLRNDWWQERITVLERARTNKPIPSSSGAIPVLPSMLGQHAIAELVGDSGASS